MADIIQIRRGLASAWTAADTVLAHGEMGWETDTGKVKIGDGTTEWTSLPYGGIVGPEGPAGPTGATGATGAAGQGVPAGGTAAQALTKIDGTDYNTQWSTLPAASTSIVLTSGQFRRAALTGDVTASENSNATTIANNAVTNAKAADMANATIKGRATSGSGDPEDLTAAQVATILDLEIRDIPAVVNPGSINLAQAHLGRVLAKTNNTAQTITIQQNSTVAIKVGTAVTFANMGGSTNNMTVARAGSTAIYRNGTNANLTIAPGNSVTLVKIATDNWQA